ncbi:hypothetical protein TWF730_011241 [Orbilia blumenaviensis]|uniref:Uncharacterized protein n=1 Tax=Orbilia blumenaviensis TaxID=1796055 RepID=A0AAV9UM36_9PEZI
MSQFTTRYLSRHVPSLILTLAASPALELPSPAPAAKPKAIDNREDSEQQESYEELEKQPSDTIDKDHIQNEIYRSFTTGHRANSGSNTLLPESVIRNPGGIFITTDITRNINGTQRGYRVQPFNQCTTLNAPWLYTISSSSLGLRTKCVFYARDRSSANHKSVIGQSLGN